MSADDSYDRRLRDRAVIYQPPNTPGIEDLARFMVRGYDEDNPYVNDEGQIPEKAIRDIGLWLAAHPDYRGDQVLILILGMETVPTTLYHYLMMDPRVGVDHPVLRTLLARRPNPNTTQRGLTDLVQNLTGSARRAEREGNPGLAALYTAKATLARQVLGNWSAAVPGKIAMLSTRGTGLPLEIEERISTFGTGVTGSVPQQLSKMAVRIPGMPGVSARRGGRKKARKSRRRRITRRTYKQ